MNETNLLHDVDEITSILADSEISALILIMKSEQDVKTRKNAAIHLLKLIDDGLEVDAEPIHSLYLAEKDMGVATELKRIQNKLHLVKKFRFDPVSAFDRKLSSADEAQLREEVDRLRNLYDKTRMRKGAFNKNYRIIKKIKDGGMGRVFKGIRLVDNRAVAIKFPLIAESMTDIQRESLLARFRREGELLTKRLKHPHIIEAFEYGESDGECFLVMEYFDGGTLDNRIETGPMAFDVFRRIAFQLLIAVEYLHQNSVIHRDIHPGNILVSDWNGAEAIKLCDFGLAKDKRDASLSHFRFGAGTDEYSSPQQLADARTADERDDIYSLGKTFYEMLTGIVLAENSRYEEIFGLNYTVPKELNRIVAQCIEYKKEHRFQSVSDLHKAILQI